MARYFILIFSLVVLSSCKSNDKRKVSVKSSHQSTSNNRSTRGSIYDSSVVLFGDTAYQLHLHIFKMEMYDETKPNATLTLKCNRNGVQKVVLVDSLYCMQPDIDFKDFNNDGIKDLLIFNYIGGRANPTYHLYLVNNRKHVLEKVKGFEQLPNPELDSASNIITSVALAGMDNLYAFYRINKKNKLINLGHSFKENPRDTDQFNRVIKKIKKENRVD